MAGGGVGEAMLISAVTGAGTAAVTGGDPLKGALLGAATGGIGHGIAGATSTAANVGAQTAAETAGNEAIANMGAEAAGFNAAPAATTSGIDPTALGSGFPGDPMNVTTSGIDPTALGSGFPGDPTNVTTSAVTTTPVVSPPPPQQMFPKIANMAQSDYFYPGLGVAAGAIGAGPETNMPEEEKYSGSLGRFNYDPDRYRPYRAASGGLMDTEPARRMAAGGLGSYSDGGQMLKGPGDGMSDDIPASIGDEQPARLADGEFVVPADVVSGIGNGSTDAGAEALYAMLDRVRKARTGRTEQAPEIDAQRMMPA
jgi:hypothetical protein